MNTFFRRRDLGIQLMKWNSLIMKAIFLIFLFLFMKENWLIMKAILLIFLLKSNIENLLNINCKISYKHEEMRSVYFIALHFIRKYWPFPSQTVIIFLNLRIEVLHCKICCQHIWINVSYRNSRNVVYILWVILNILEYIEALVKFIYSPVYLPVWQFTLCVR